MTQPAVLPLLRGLPKHEVDRAGQDDGDMSLVDLGDRSFMPANLRSPCGPEALFGCLYPKWDLEIFLLGAHDSLPEF